MGLAVRLETHQGPCAARMTAIVRLERVRVNMPAINPPIRALPVKAASPDRAPEAIRLDKGEFPYPPLPAVVEAIAAAAPDIHRYPDLLGGDLRARLADYAGVAPEQVVVTNGSDDAIELVLKVCLPPGGSVLLPTPTFFVYGFSARLLGRTVVEVPMPQRTGEFAIVPDDLLAQAESAQVLFLANPNNPTGGRAPRAAIADLLERFAGWVVVDECYFEYGGDTIADLLDTYPNAIVLRSLSKSFGLAGTRVGYALASPEVADHLYRAAQIFAVNRLAIAAGIAALNNREAYATRRAELLAERDRLAAELHDLGARVYPSAANFLFVSTEPLEMTSAEIAAGLRDRQIWVADFGGKQGLAPHYLRVATGTPAENQAFLAGLRQVVGRR